MSGPNLIQEEHPRQCGDCGKIAECRPYGPDGSVICFECMLKDEEGAKERMLERIYGDGPREAEYKPGIGNPQ